jgi:hypothetical protein
LSEQKPKTTIIPGYESIAMRAQDVKKRFTSTIQNVRQDSISRNVSNIERVNLPLMTEDP